MGERRILAAVLAVAEHRVTMRERPALRVLTREAHRHAVDKQRTERQRFGVAPLDTTLLAHRLTTTLELLGQARIRLEIGRPGEQRFVHIFQLLDRHVGGDSLRRRRRLGWPRRVLLAAQQRLLEARVDLRVVLRHRLLDLGRFGLGDHALGHQPTGPHLRHRGVLANARRARGLRVHRLVAFVVPVATITHEVDQHVLLERGAIRARQTHRRDAGLRIISVHVENRHLETLREIRRVVRGAGIGRVGGEADLVIHDDVNRAASAVRIQVRDVERFGHDALARKRRVAMNGDRHHREFVSLTHAARHTLQRAHHAFDDRVHHFEVRRIGCETQRDRLAVHVPRADEAHVILHVARRVAIDVIVTTFELGEQAFERLAHHVREHV